MRSKLRSNWRRRGLRISLRAGTNAPRNRHHCEYPSNIFMVLLVATSRLALFLLLGFAGCLGPTKDVGPTQPVVRDQTRLFQKDVDSWRRVRNRNVVIQQEDYSCGAAALATVAQHYWGDSVKEAEFLISILNSLDEEGLKDRVKNGLSMTDLRKAAIDKGYLASMGRRTLSQLMEIKIPVIIRIKKDKFEHFVVFRGIREDRVFLADPIRGNLRLPIDEFKKQWTDDAILVIVKKGAKIPKNSPLLVTDNDLPVRPELQAGRRFLFVPR